MHRLCATVLFAYAGLSAAQWGHASRWLFDSPGVLWCGNVISEPFSFLVNVVGPMAAVCAAVLVRRCLAIRRWPCYSIAALLVFVVTSACLVYENHFLADYGLGIGRIWWAPWRR